MEGNIGDMKSVQQPAKVGVISLRTLLRPPWRTIISGLLVFALLGLGYLVWTPGLDIRDGRHDLGHNAIWLAHGWLGADEWFVRNGKTNQFAQYRDPQKIRELADRLRRNHITDIYPHLCPTDSNGDLPKIDPYQVERFLDGFDSFRVMPWIGGPNGANVLLYNKKWRVKFTNSVHSLLVAHPRFAGVQINVEPLPSGDTNFVSLLDDLRRSMPSGKILSVAAYPPPTRWHPYSDVHWDRVYLMEVARRSDQLAVMSYDVGQKYGKTYQKLMADWTQEVLSWSEGKPVCLGVPTYHDAGVGYHNPDVENITNALLGIHRGLSREPLPTNYQGVAIYCDWETDDTEWSYFREHFLKPDKKGR